MRSKTGSPGVKRRPAGKGGSGLKPEEAPSRSAEPSPADATALKVSDDVVKRMTEVFRMLADTSRLKILLALAQDGRLHVSALCDLLGQSQPAVSHHLTLMRMARLVDFQRVGKHNYYRVASHVIGELFDDFFKETENPRRELVFGNISLAYAKQ